MSMERNAADEEPRRNASPAYALDRLRRAVETATGHADTEARRRAEEKSLAWEAVLDGMASGRLDVGSRTPVESTPPWVTLEVAHGGFATGRYVAEGTLDEEELRILEALPSGDPMATARQRLNTWYLSDEGLSVLVDALRARAYAVDVPEHSAILVVAWLVSRGHDAAAMDLVAELYPFIGRLRFYPALQSTPTTSGAVVRLETVGEVSQRLGATIVPPQIAAMNETLTVWHPLYDRLVELWSDTVVDGWPCARWPEHWVERRSTLLADYRAAAAANTLSGEHARPRSTFAILRDALEKCEHDSCALNGRDVGRIRDALVRSVSRWGVPGSAERQGLRAEQRALANRPTNQAIAGSVVTRLEPLPSDAGIADLEAIVGPVAGDASGPSIPLPTTIVRKVERALEAPIEELVERRIVPSSEVLARVLPQISSHVASATFDDDQLRDLYARTYAAFRRRRSVVLLNLESQVSIDELPWVGALAGFKTSTPSSRTNALDTLQQVTLLALTSFPQTILPNPLLTEMAALAKQAEVDLTIVEEVAADIFMGTFTLKWRSAAAAAATHLEGSLYARYFSLPPAHRWAAPLMGSGLVDRARERWGKPVADDFATLCNERAREAASGDGSRVARNGAVIEQSQILTTQNLAPVVAALDLLGRLEPRSTELATRVFRWIVRQQNTQWNHRRVELQMMKNTAYAWRQALYFLSLVDIEDQAAAAAALRQAADEHPGPWRERFEQVIVGLDAAIGGSSFDETGRLDGGRRFLGWSVGPHWLFPKRDVPSGWRGVRARLRWGGRALGPYPSNLNK